MTPPVPLRLPRTAGHRAQYNNTSEDSSDTPFTYHREYQLPVFVRKLCERVVLQVKVEFPRLHSVLPSTAATVTRSK